MLLYATSMPLGLWGQPTPATRHIIWLAPLLPAGRWCLVCQLASWFNAYTLVRTYSNCLEALCVAAGTYHWLCSSGGGSGGSSGGSRSSSGRSSRGKANYSAQRQHQRAWVACAALCVVFRPASALFWVLPAGLALWQQRSRGLGGLLLDAAAVGGGILAASLAVDRAFYGR